MSLDPMEDCMLRLDAVGWYFSAMTFDPSTGSYRLVAKKKFGDRKQVVQAYDHASGFDFLAQTIEGYSTYIESKSAVRGKPGPTIDPELTQLLNNIEESNNKLQQMLDSITSRLDKESTPPPVASIVSSEFSVRFAAAPPRPGDDAGFLARQFGVSRRTIERAAQKLGIESDHFDHIDARRIRAEVER